MLLPQTAARFLTAKPTSCLSLLPRRRLPPSSTEAFPQLNQWSDVLFYATINGLYNAAALDAVVSVGEAWADTAIRFAIWASPVVRRLPRALRRRQAWRLLRRPTAAMHASPGR